MEGQLSCTICMEHYDTSERLPLVGICGHSICLACWTQMSERQCPTCRMTYAFLRKTVNYGLREHLENSFRQLVIDGDHASQERDSREEVNLVVVGETGVGKASWINAIANYITYETFEVALSKPHINLIPSKFTISVKNGPVMKETPVSAGAECANEVHKEAASSTQFPRAYVFAHNNKKYRIIDRPGIGDTRGIDQDRENIGNIINFLAKYKKIHAICILIEPTQSKLTERFEFCFNELIMQLHRSAVENIMFCFTSSNGSGFCVGETHEPLEKLIKDINERRGVNIVLDGTTMYPFDNMSYRYLWAKSIATPFELAADLESIYKESFTLSRLETLRLLHHISTLPPHNVEDSTTLNYVRIVIEKLTEPLAVINAKVNKTLINIRERKKDIDANKNRQRDLQKTLRRKLKIGHYELKSEVHRYCETCSKSISYTGAQRLVSKNPLMFYHVTRLLDGNEPCQTCGDRENVVETEKKYLIFREEKEKEQDPNRRVRLTDMETLQKEAQRQLFTMKILQEETSLEQEEILNASAQFACFMRRNCITTYNDVEEIYLTFLIKAAQSKNKQDQEEAWTAQLERYQMKKRLYEENMRLAGKQHVTSIGPNDVLAVVNKLQQLKHYGRDVALALNSAHDQTNEVPFDHVHHSRKTSLVHAPRRAFNYVRKRLGCKSQLS